jgi:hypothetical protein
MEPIKPIKVKELIQYLQTLPQGQEDYVILELQGKVREDGKYSTIEEISAYILNSKKAKISNEFSGKVGDEVSCCVSLSIKD